MRSACRGDARKTSMPKREMSKRGVPAAIISMAQHARPMVTGHIEPLRASPTAFSTVVSMNPAGSFSSRPMLSSSVPLKGAAPPLVGERHGDDGDESERGDEAEGGQLTEGDGPRHEEDDLDVEDDEGHGHEVVLDGEAAGARGARGGLHTALVVRDLDPVSALGPDDRARRQGA